MTMHKKGMIQTKHMTEVSRHERSNINLNKNDAKYRGKTYGANNVPNAGNY